MSKTELGAQVRELRARIASELPTPASIRPPGGWGLQLGRQLASGYEALLAPVFARVGAANVALAAVGGFGRGAVALSSDLDVRILAKSASDAEAVVDDVLYPLWDGGIQIGHQILLLGDAVDLARTDLPTLTGLIDWRHLAGNRELSDELVWRVSGSLFSASELGRFAERLADEAEKRHERYGDSVYLLEPDVKNGAGGLRDLDILRWAAAARCGSGEIETLLKVGALGPREANDLGQAEERFWCVRHLLHQRAGRRSDRLTFDAQESIAPLLGYGEGGEGVERMMSDHYRAARVVLRGVSVMLARATHTGKKRPKTDDLGDGFRLFDGAITLADTTRLETEPALALKLIALAIERQKPLYAYVREVIQDRAGDPAWCERFRDDPVARKLFVELVSSRREAVTDKGSALRKMHDLGLLVAMIPEFSPVVGRVHHDVYHVYTVDVHSVAAVDKLAALARGELAAEHPIASRVAAETLSPAMLAFATLLHDVGKAIGGKDHSQRGAEMAKDILARLGFGAEEIEEASHLIFEHLSLYRLATRRDIDDPATIDEASRAGRTREGLRNLYLLTLVDVATTSPTSMTSWKAHLLDELFLSADERLSGTSGEVGRAELLRKEIVSFALGYFDPNERDAELAFLPRYLASMPDRYLLSSSAEAVVAHGAIVRKHRGAVTVDVVPSAHPDATELCVVATDRPGLLSLIAAALAMSRLEVLAAQVYSRDVGAGGGHEAVDLFWVQGRAEGKDAVVRALPKLRRDLEALVSGAAEPRIQLGLATPRRAGPKIATRVAIDHRASPEHTLIEVTTLDRPGVLFAIANALYALGLSIAVAKINTEGTRVADVFYVTDRGGAKLEPGPRVDAVRQAILASLGEGPSPEATDASKRDIAPDHEAPNHDVSQSDRRSEGQGGAQA
jgi:[protein-PII] uridylyltransferase